MTPIEALAIALLWAGIGGDAVQCMGPAAGINPPPGAYVERPSGVRVYLWRERAINSQGWALCSSAPYLEA